MVSVNDRLFMEPHSYTTDELIHNLYALNKDSIGFALANRLESLNEQAKQVRDYDD